MLLNTLRLLFCVLKSIHFQIDHIIMTYFRMRKQGYRLFRSWNLTIVQSIKLQNQRKWKIGFYILSDTFSDSMQKKVENRICRIQSWTQMNLNQILLHQILQVRIANQIHWGCIKWDKIIWHLCPILYGCLILNGFSKLTITKAFRFLFPEKLAQCDYLIVNFKEKNF